MQALEAMLARHPFFEGIVPQYLSLIAGCAAYAHYEPGEYIFHEGELATHFYLICQGKVVLETFAGQRPTITIATIEAGGALGWSWLFPPYQWHFSARASAPTWAIALDGACLRCKSEEDHNFGYALLKQIAAIVVQQFQVTQQQLLDVYNAAIRSHT